MDFPRAWRSLFLGLGSNLGNRAVHLEAGLKALQTEGFAIVQRSRVYETEPVGCLSPGPFLNQVVEVTTGLTPREVLRRLQRVEARRGRRPGPRNAPRPLDIDLLLDGATVVNDGILDLPHPRLHLRRFVLVPLVEIAPRALHPVLGATAAQLLERCSDRSEVWPWTGRRKRRLPLPGTAMYDSGRPEGGRFRSSRGRPNN